MGRIGRQLHHRTISTNDNVPQRQHRLELGPMEGSMTDGKLAQEVVPGWIEGAGGGHGGRNESKFVALG